MARAKKKKRKSSRPIPPARQQARSGRRSGRVAVDPADAERRAAEARRAWARYAQVRRTGWAMVVLGLVVAGVHFIDHSDVFHLFNEGLEELLIGWPTAGLLALVGAVCLGQLNPAERRR